MKKTVQCTTVLMIMSIGIQAGGDITQVEAAPVVATDTLVNAFTNGKVSGQIRAGYINFNPKLSGEPTTFATALGGQLKYETAPYHGFYLGAAFYTSHTVNGLSGDRSDKKRNYELSGDDRHYDLLGEVYAGYKLDRLNIKAGRQLIDTPYADSDDIRMTPNTFEGIVASYVMGDFSFIGAYLTKWQGPDADDYDFVDLLGPGANGVTMAAVTYASDSIEAGLWYYGADKTADVFYGDLIGTYAISEDIELKGGLQYANQSERSNSGIDATLFGAMAELGFAGVTLGAAYDTLNVDDGKGYFGGFGGGVGFVNMDEMTAGTFIVSQGADAFKVGIAYDFAEIGADGFTTEYNYGRFEGDKHSSASEQDFYLTYAHGETWDVEVTYAIIKDVDKDIGEDVSGNPADGGFDRLLVRANYNF